MAEASDPLAVFSSRTRERLPALEAAFLPPALAVLSDERVLGDEWVLERKLDGIRCLAVASRDGAVQLLTRNELDRTAGWPSIASAVAGLGVDVVLDGEVLAMEGDAPLGFGALQQGGRAIALWAFDLLMVAGRDLRGLPQHERRSVLEALLPEPLPALRLIEELPGPSEERYAEACASAWEGLIAKRRDAPYGGGRSRDWLKLKCLAEQEVVVGGYTEPRGSRTGFGALLCGYYEDGVLRYAGKVGTGFGRATLDALTSRLVELERADSPFGEPVKPRPPGTHWVEPELVAQVAFAEWTTAGRLRQPRFLGLREDKAASEVVRERA